ERSAQLKRCGKLSTVAAVVLGNTKGFCAGVRFGSGLGTVVAAATLGDVPEPPPRLLPSCVTNWLSAGPTSGIMFSSGANAAIDFFRNEPSFDQNPGFLSLKLMLPSGLCLSLYLYFVPGIFTSELEALTGPTPGRLIMPLESGTAVPALARPV